MAAAFEYKALRKNEIRLCHVFSIDPFECELVHVNIKSRDPPSYAALSYVWGDATATEPILCSSHILQVTKSLKEALRGTRPHNESRYIWADQICIDQTNIRERNDQVQNMATTYQSAKSVLVWFGKELPSTTLALDMVRLAEKANACQAADEDRGYDDVVTRRELTRKYAQHVGLPAFSDEKPWRALVELYENPWFGRLWVVQETLSTHLHELGARSMKGQSQPAWVIIGEHKISYLELRIVGGWMWMSGHCCPARWNRDTAIDCCSTVLVPGSGSKSHGLIRFNLLTLLTQFRSRKCANPRDRVYGLLGISDLHPDSTRPMASMIDNAQAKIKIDYSQTVLQVYHSAARAIIAHNVKVFERNSGGINIVCSAVPHSLDAGWPSWLPDWRLRGDAAEKDPHPLTSQWPAGRLAARVHQHPDKNCLVVEGVILDQITWTYDETHLGQILLLQDPSILGKSIESRLGQNYQPWSVCKRESTIRAFVLTLTAGVALPSLVAVHGDDAEEVFAYTFFDFVRAFSMPRTTTIEEQMAKYDELARYWKIGYDDSWAVHPHRMLCQRRLFTTKDGWIGLGFKALQEGDIVAVIFGLKTIAILRPRSDDPTADGYEYIGEAYVRGTSDGELVPAFTRDEKGNVIGTKFALW